MMEQLFTFYNRLLAANLKVSLRRHHCCIKGGLLMSNSTTFAPGTVLVLVGTKRGLFLLSSRDRERWEVNATGLSGSRIFYAMLDQRSGHRMFAADNGDFFGSFIRYSDDFGQTWTQARQGIAFPEGSG